MKRETILATYKFIDWIMALPAELELKVYEELRSKEEATKMAHITTAERIGREVGREEGQKIAMQQAVATVISSKFGKLGRPLIKRSRQVASLEVLEKMLAKLAQSPNLSEAAKVLDEIELQSKKRKKLRTN